ncbi:hypothetical protein A2U01_0029621, partial [Trifolium medium]|nr:hypothetical protein [Trifolium medium]
VASRRDAPVRISSTKSSFSLRGSYSSLLRAVARLRLRPHRITLLAASACPLVWGCSTDVKCCFVLIAARNSWNFLSVNCVPLSVTTAYGIPNRHNMSLLKKRSTLNDVISERGSAQPIW